MAEREGSTAYKEGKPLSANPHRYAYKLRDDWVRGWENARQLNLIRESLSDCRTA